jgi:multidrug efflux pump subunit AcrA (membrane-fusion protein)
VVQTPVQLGKLQGDRYPLISGLQMGERIVVSNTALLRTGLPVKIGSAAAN